jgi:hypothetical protein
MEINKIRTRSTSTSSTGKSSGSGVPIDASSSFTHSHNSAFTSASSKSSHRSASTEDDMASVMAELLEKTPSELYAIIHDLDPKETRRRRKQKNQEEESIDSEDSAAYESVGESSLFYESAGEFSSCSSDSASYISFVNSRRKEKRSTQGGSFTEKIFGRRFVCHLPTMCGIGRGEEKTLSYVDDNETFVNGKD